MILRDLEPGDIFIHAKAKYPEKFLVKGNPMFNRRHGSATRKCIDLKKKITIGKSCLLEVTKIGESKHKAKYLELAKTKQQ